MKRSASISEILRPLADNPFQAYLSNAVQVADILEWILEQVGVAEVWQTSFSISEEFLRRLFFITKDKRVSRINNRHESAFISTSPKIFANLHAQVNDLITNHSVPLHDLFRERINAD